MKSALLIVDVQNEFVADPRLAPGTEFFLQKLTALLESFRGLKYPILHAHYVTEKDGRGYLLHHKKEGRKRCERGTTEAAPHPLAEPEEGEPVFAKHAYSAFSSTELETHLQKIEVDTLIICGLYSHVCVRQTALDALERNYRVKVARDAIASYDRLHAQITQSFLTDRGVEYITSHTLIDQLSKPAKQSASLATADQTYPVACIDGTWIPRTNEELVELRNPSHWNQALGYVPIADSNVVESAVSTAVIVQRVWKSKTAEERLAVVEKWADVLESRFDQFLPHMVKEVGKPVTACYAEFGLLKDSIRVLRQTFTDEPYERVCKETTDQVALARRCPRGVVAIISPWNNPVFLPASKVVAAIALGNGVVWKPALPCAQTSAALQNSLLEAGLPAGLVNLIYGGASTARQLISHQGISAVTLTGSVETGKQVAATCGSLLKPLQAELGGNNAAIITEDCDLQEVADKIAINAFGYAGQACTATRRLIVMAPIAVEFLTLLKKSVQELVIGDPNEVTTTIGPVISQSKQQEINQQVAAVANDADIFEVNLPRDLCSDGCWLPPRIIQGLPQTAPLVQQETFAPVLVVQTATDLKEAIRLCNGVPNGLIAAIFCNDETILTEFQDQAEAGVIQLNLPSRNLHMESPFGGWKESGLGPPEHGQWDLDFYTRWQAVNKKGSHLGS
jgi:acyl-CoA reductase-like NAD-dependent aldehyde dehydrogenase/nicotinamidase-related amidase